MNALTTLAAALAITTAVAGTAQAAAADDALNGAVEQYRSLQARSEWHNPLMPSGTGMYAAATAPSGEQTLMTIVAGYGRSLLDRGGWSNPWVAESTYASGEPLLAVRIGDGVTTRTAAAPAPTHRDLAWLQQR
jgi:hypothetical protein